MKMHYEIFLSIFFIQFHKICTSDKDVLKLKSVMIISKNVSLFLNCGPSVEVMSVNRI